MLNSLLEVSKSLNISEIQIQAVLDLLQEGSTVPFIARYRKNITGGLNEEQIESINKKYQYTIELNKRKEAIIELLKEANLLTAEIKEAILKAKSKSEVENIYEPFKIGKKTKATEAIALGLEPLAKIIFNNEDNQFNPYFEAQKYLNEKVIDVNFAIEQSELIIAQWISQDLWARAFIKDQFINYGYIVTKKKAKAIDEKEKFRQYYDNKELVRVIPDHRIMAINRGVQLKILSSSIEYNEKKVIYDLNNRFFKVKTTGKIILNALKDSLKRLLIPSVEREVKKQLFERATESAIKLFGKNLEAMLLSPAIKNKVVLAIDPAFASGCKVAVLSKQGDLLHVDLIYPTPPFNKIEQAEKIINKLIKDFNIDIIVVGNGTASRETENFISQLISKSDKKIPFSIVSEVGASVYSASKIAINEFPDLSVEQRSAIHIGRKFQDPLNELVKIDPKSIGVGQYQHDVDQKALSENLTFKVNKVVNLVGVDINTATTEILSYISGLSKKTSNNILEYRKENGLFKNRKDIKKVKGLGPKAFEQSVGFLRILDSNNFFDKTQIHPESYGLAEKIVEDLNLDLSNIDKAKLQNINFDHLVEKHNSNLYDVKLIVDSLLSPGKDIRDNRSGPLLKTDVLKISDLKPGLELEGVVQNITDFGAFIYIGLKQAALIHISNLAEEYVKHPSDIVQNGQKVLVEIIEIEKERERIQARLLNKI